jgi:hypothetical protein
MDATKRAHQIGENIEGLVADALKDYLVEEKTTNTD